MLAVLFGVLLCTDRTVLGPLLYILYTAPMYDTITQHRVNAHHYADDLQLYICLLPADATIATDHLDECLVNIDAWLKASRLRLNPSKTPWLEYAHQLAKVRLDDVPVLSSQLRVVNTARNLGIVLIVNCQCLHMLQQSVVAAYINCGHSRYA